MKVKGTNHRTVYPGLPFLVIIRRFIDHQSLAHTDPGTKSGFYLLVIACTGSEFGDVANISPSATGRDLGTPLLWRIWGGESKSLALRLPPDVIELALLTRL